MPSGTQPQPPDFTVRLAFNNTYEGVPWSNVMWADVATSDTPLLSDFDGWLGEQATAYAVAFLPFLNETVTGTTVQGTFFGAGSDAIDGEGSTVASGAQTGAAESANVAACISWSIAAHYRGGHPRTYLCGIPVASRINPTTFDGGFTDDLAAAAINFRESFNGHPLAGNAVRLGTVSFVHANAWRSPPIFRPYADSAVVDSRVDTQRRRLGRDR